MSLCRETSKDLNIETMEKNIEKKKKKENLLLKSQLVGRANRKIVYLYKESCFFMGGNNY